MKSFAFPSPGSSLPRVAFWLALAWLAWASGQWAIRLFAPAPLPLPPVPAPAATLSTDADWRNLMVGSGKFTGPIVLKGVVISNGPDNVAALSVDGKPARAYRAGDEIAPGTLLDSVRTASVIVKRNGIAEEIALAQPRKTTPR